MSSKTARFIFTIASLVMALLIGITISAHAQAASATAWTPAHVDAAPTNIMGPSNEAAKFVGNTVTLPKVASATCFNIYRDGALIAKCVQPSIENNSDGSFWYYDDHSPEVTPSSRFTYEVSAVNATGESPRYGQGGPYPSNH